jgi:hypothetical protein
MWQKLTSFKHSLAPHGGKEEKGFIGSVKKERHDKRTGARRGKGDSSPWGNPWEERKEGTEMEDEAKGGGGRFCKKGRSYRRSGRD